MSKEVRKKKASEAPAPPDFTHPMVGSVCTVIAGLLFLLLCMILPLVGPAGFVMPYASLNALTFTGVLVLALVFALAAVYSKWERRKKDQSPRPYGSLLLCVLLLFVALAYFSGLLRI